MSYTQNSPHYEAVQFTGTNASAFEATVDPGSSMTWMVNADGSLNYYGGGDFPPGTNIPAGSWVVSEQYWGTFPGWSLSNAADLLPDAEFTAKYSAI